VQADREHVGVALENSLDAIAVMDVDVHVCDAMTLLLQPLTGDGSVVVGAEAGGAVAMSVVQSSAGAESVARGTAVDSPGSDEACPHHERGALVKVVRDRVVGRGEAGGVDPLGRYLVATHRVAQLADEVDVVS
jgi:hypothetical protein